MRIETGRQMNFKLENRKVGDEEKIILETMKKVGEPLSVDKIIELTKLEPRVVSCSLDFLSIGNFIKETESGYSI